MKTTTMTISMLALAAGCSEDADIGTSMDPVTCMTNPNGAVAIAEVSGTVRDPNTGTTFEFAEAMPSATAPTGPTVTLRGSELLLRFGFYCGAATIASYGVKGDTQRGLECPLEVASAMLGQIEYLPAESGTLIVDESSNCLAGRFRVDFGEYGEVTGWFSTPWQ